MAAIPETAEAEVRRLRKELANERADCAVAIEALQKLLASHKPGTGQCCQAADLGIAALAKLGASK